MPALLLNAQTAPARALASSAGLRPRAGRAVAALPRRAVITRAAIEDEAANKVEQVVQEASTPNLPNPSPSSPVVAAPVPNSSPSFTDALAFAGPGPEVINGRLAMVAFISAAGAEFATGFTAVQQLAQAPALVGVTAVIFTVASLIPIFRGVSPASKSNGPFTPTAELLNGRAAMLGFAALLATEWAKGAAVF